MSKIIKTAKKNSVLVSVSKWFTTPLYFLWTTK